MTGRQCRQPNATTAEGLRQGERELNINPKENGGVAQLGEHLPCKQGVMGSNPIISTRRQIAAAKRRKKQGEGSRETRYTEDDYMGS